MENTLIPPGTVVVCIDGSAARTGSVAPWVVEHAECPVAVVP